MQEFGISWDPGKPLTQLVWQVWQTCQTSYPGPLETAIPGGSWNRYPWDGDPGEAREGSKRQKATFPKKQRFPCVYAAPHMRSALSIRKTQLLGPSRPFWAETRFKEKRGFGAIPGVWLGWGIPWNKPWKPLFQPYPGSQEYALSGVSLGSRNCLE